MIGIGSTTFKISEFTQQRLIYCCLVSSLGDWHHECYCDYLLVEKQQEVYEEYGHEDSIWGEAARLDPEEIHELQDSLKSLSADNKWVFTQTINSFLYIGLK